MGDTRVLEEDIMAGIMRDFVFKLLCYFYDIAKREEVSFFCTGSYIAWSRVKLH
jgi:hypothetical protein